MLKRTTTAPGAKQMPLFDVLPNITGNMQLSFIPLILIVLAMVVVVAVAASVVAAGAPASAAAVASASPITSSRVMIMP